MLTSKPVRKILLSILVAAVALLAVGITLAFTLRAPEQTSESQPDIPRYTADQVIAIVQAEYPACFKKELIGQDVGGIFRYIEVNTPPIISVKPSYMLDLYERMRVAERGGSTAVWEVTVRCPFGYHFRDYTRSKVLYFYEWDGSLRNR
jgi:hypothetical protein